VFTAPYELNLSVQIKLIFVFNGLKSVLVFSGLSLVLLRDMKAHKRVVE